MRDGESIHQRGKLSSIRWGTMKKHTKTYNKCNVASIAVGLLICAANASFGALNVTTTSSATDLANAILGPGITLNSASYTGGSGAAGTFSGGSSIPLGFNNGIVLTTGLAATAGSGVNSSASFSTDNGMPGDAA